MDVKAINDFALKYKMSSEEEKDVLSNYERYKGDLIKMLEHVMLSEERDCLRWMEDYIKPAVESGKAKDYLEKASKVLTRIRIKLKKEVSQANRETGNPFEARIDRPKEDIKGKQRGGRLRSQPRPNQPRQKRNLEMTLLSLLYVLGLLPAIRLPPWLLDTESVWMMMILSMTRPLL